MFDLYVSVYVIYWFIPIGHYLSHSCYKYFSIESDIVLVFSLYFEDWLRNQFLKLKDINIKVTVTDQVIATGSTYALWI